MAVAFVEVEDEPVASGSEVRRYILRRQQKSLILEDDKLIVTLQNELKKTLKKEITVMVDGSYLCIKGVFAKWDKDKLVKGLESKLGFTLSEAEFGYLCTQFETFRTDVAELKSNPTEMVSDVFDEMTTGVEMTKVTSGAGSLGSSSDSGSSSTSMISPRTSGRTVKQLLIVKEDRVYWTDSRESELKSSRSVKASEIDSVTPHTSKMQFTVKGRSKTLTFKTKTLEIRDKWVIYLNLLRNHFVRARRGTAYLASADRPLDDALEDVD